ncbi:uncharacterized protein ELE39_002684 [Cryptosporidium sp. chipmunk genotype I]|uniref:uncharacterized protein n=1 Tax=Cryptosporidium sp. chipmunk genotype I TaxID=1280935 RepID=UPI00351A19A4|nr:hypothetical protein ELE39_002684 [Cryptosporidium sp. chipmunk genotype I]
MRKSLASLVGNIGNSIGLGGTPSRGVRDFNEENNETNDFEISSKRGTYGLSSLKKLYISPSRPSGLPPPLPYNSSSFSNNRKDDYSRNIDNNHAVAASLSSVENTRILTPFNIRNGINSIQSYKEVDDGDGSNMFKESILRINSDLGNNIGEKTPQTTKSQVRIKSVGMTPSRFENLSGNMTSNSNKINVGSSSIFTPLSTKTRFLPILPTSPRKEIYENLKSNLPSIQNENKLQPTRMSNEIKIDSSFSENLIPSTATSASNLENENYLSESLDILRKRLNEKNQEAHFLKKTVKDLEARIISLENKEKMFVENEVNNKKKVDELLIENHENMNTINNLKKEIIKLQEDNSNIIKENKCINGNYELKCYEITKLNDEINNIQSSYKNNFTSKYLTPLKNILYESILEIERKIGNVTIMNVEFEKSNMEIDAIIKTLHEYIQNFKNFITLKIDQDYNIIENLHSELSNVNTDFLQLKKEYIHLKKSYNDILRKDSYSIINKDENNDKNDSKIIKDKELRKDSIVINEQDRNDHHYSEPMDLVLESQNDYLLQEPCLNTTPKSGGTSASGLLGSNKLQFGLTSLAKSLLGYTYISRTSLFDNNNSPEEKEKKENSFIISKDFGLKSKKSISKKNKDDNKTKTTQGDKSKKKVLKRIDKNKNQENLKTTSTISKNIQSIDKKKSSLKSKKSLSSLEINQIVSDHDQSNEISITPAVKSNKSNKANAKSKSKVLNELEAKTNSNIKSSTPSKTTSKRIKSEDKNKSLKKEKELNKSENVSAGKTLKKSSEKNEFENHQKQSKTKSNIKKRKL